MGMGGGRPKASGTVQYEPIKPAEESMKEASSETARAQQLRRGLASTFSRPGMMGGEGVSATSGTATKLGA